MKKTLLLFEFGLNSLTKPSLKMKLTYFLLFISFFQCYASLHGQINNVTLKMENSSVKQVFSTIEKKTGYRFLYNIDKINLKRKTSISAINKPVKDVLDKLFKGTDVNFVFLDKQIIVKRNGKQKALKNVQNIIEGKVFDEFGLPVSGATVTIKNSEKGALTDFDGSFSITASVGDILLVSYLSYTETEVLVTEASTYEIYMRQAIEFLDAVIVSTGYEEILKERATGSFEKVSQKVLEPKVTQDVISKLEGEVPGLLFDQGAGQRGAQANNRIFIRGRNTINGDERPLIVVDGIPLEGQPFNNIFSDTGTVNPNDVKSITVLKDAAAASIWGIRAANGVIVIETKKGKRNSKIDVNFSTSTSLTRERDIDGYRFASAQNQVNFVRDLLDATGDDLINENQFFNGTLTNQNITLINPVVQTVFRQRNGDITASEAASRFEELSETDIRRDLKNLLRTQVWNQYSLSISGGADRYDFNASFLHNDNKLERVGNSAKQTIVSLRNSYDFTDRLKANASINFTKSSTDNGFFDADPFFAFANESINSNILDANGNYLPMQNGGEGASAEVSNALLANGFLYPQTYNLQQEVDNADNTEKTTNIRLLAGLNYKITDNLNATANYQYETTNNRRRNFSNENTFLTRSSVNNFTQIDNNNIATGEFPIPQGSILDGATDTSKSFTARFQLNYDNEFNDGLHKITALAGYEVRKTIEESISDSRLYGYNDDNLSSQQVDLINRFSNPLFLGGGIRISDPGFFLGRVFLENRFISSYANAAYTFNDKYTLSGSIRLDDTNLFGASDQARNIPLYSVGIKWNLAKEFFAANAKVNNLSLRSTYGANGNVARGTTNFLQTLSGVEFDIFRQRSSFISNAPNPRLRLEKTKSFNVGLDFDLFEKNRLFGSIEYYRNISDDLLANQRINSTTGVSSLLLNTGRLQNKGMDISLGFQVISSNNFNYVTRGTFSVNENELLKSDFESNDIFSFVSGRSLKQGDNINTQYALRYAGLDRNGNPQYLDADNRIMRFDDPEINNVRNLNKIGLSRPKYFGSWINEFDYKRLSLRVLTTFKAGYVFQLSREFGSYFDPFYNLTSSFNVSNEVQNRWRTRGDENVTDVPRIPSVDDVLTLGYSTYQFADRQYKDASHIRLRQIALTYQLPFSALNKIGLKNLGVTLQADDIAVWTFNDLNIDPENRISQPTSVSLKLSTTF